MSTAEQAVRDDEADALFSGLENLRGLHSRGLRRSGFHGAAACSPRAGRATEKRRKRAPKLLAVTVDHGLRPEAAARGGRGQAPGAPPRRAASHAALARQKAEIRVAGGGAQRALPAAGASRRARRLCPYPHRAYARRSGGNGAVPAGPRQRARRACRHGARVAPLARRRASGDFSGAPAASALPRRG